MRKEAYLYETHLHTKEASACSKTWAKEYIRPYKEAGYSGIIVTDHFFNGNSCISPLLGWEERVSLFCRGFEQAKEEGDAQGLSVFFGFEVSYNNDDYLIYGPDKQWLLKHPQIMDWDQKQLFKEVDSIGGAMIQAHPFRERDYLDSIFLYPYVVHGVEVGNGENEVEHDRKAFAYAQAHNLPMSCGNDIHDVSKARADAMAIVFDAPLTSIGDFTSAIRQKGNYRLQISPDRIKEPTNRQAKLPIMMYDQKGKEHKIEAWEAWIKG